MRNISNWIIQIYVIRLAYPTMFPRNQSGLKHILPFQCILRYDPGVNFQMYLYVKFNIHVQILEDLKMKCISLNENFVLR